MGQFEFEVTLFKDEFYRVKLLDGDLSLILDSDGDRALRSMDEFISAAQAARAELAKVISDENEG